MSSLLNKGNSERMSPVNDYSISYVHEWNEGFNNSIGVESRRVYSNRYVPMFTPDSVHVTSVSSNQLHYTARFSWDETVTRGTFDKIYVLTHYPVVTIDLVGAAKGMSHNDFGFFRAEATVDYTLPLPPFGTSKFHLTGGKIVGKVPYPFLKLHEGNGTYFLDKSAFACMDFYEFASDTWTTLFYEHNFRGFFLGKIPVMKRLQWREVFTLKAGYGTLSKVNRSHTYLSPDMPGNPGERTGGIFFGVNGVNLHRYEEIIYRYTFLLPSDKRSRFVAEQGKSHGRHPEKERVLQDHSLHLLPGVLICGKSTKSVYTARRIKKDLVLTVSIALIIIILIIGYCFRTKDTLFYMLMPLVWGVVAAIAAVYLIQGQMSFIALGIGCIVIGVALSYCIHIITHHKYIAQSLNKKVSWGSTILKIAALVLLFPLWIFSLWPNLLLYHIPKRLTKRVKDKMLSSSFLLGVNAVITIPLFALISFIVVWCFLTIYMAVLYLLMMPPLALFCWYYTEWWDTVKEELRLLAFHKKSKIAKLRTLRKDSEKLEDRLWSLFKI